MLSDMSDSDESDLSDNDFDFKIEEVSDSENNDWDIKTEVPDDDEEKESSNWLRENCRDIQEERKVVVFESKLKELFFSSRALSELWTGSRKRNTEN